MLSHHLNLSGPYIQHRNLPSPFTTFEPATHSLKVLDDPVSIGS
jgi:hypothetical protein